jgi:transcriptional regulator with XRE-family HTH domain
MVVLITIVIYTYEFILFTFVTVKFPTMINPDDFIKRLNRLMEYYSHTASSFADKIGVQRSGISHILSGRNKPSLDFILKISEEFPQISLYWILEGKGNFLKSDVASPADDNTTDKEKQAVKPLEKDTPALPDFNTPEEIYKIVVFYSNGSFKEFNPAS